MPEIPPVREDMRREHAEVCRELALAHAQNDTLRDVVRKLVDMNGRVAVVLAKARRYAETLKLSDATAENMAESGAIIALCDNIERVRDERLSAGAGEVSPANPPREKE